MIEEKQEKSLRELSEEIKAVNLSNGWKTKSWDTPIGDKTVDQSVSKIAEECFEANGKFSKNDFEGFKEEIADVIIRCLDLAKDLGFHEELEQIIIRKNEFNKTRGFKHGKRI